MPPNVQKIWKGIRSICFALGLQRSDDTPKMNTARDESFTASVVGSLLKYVAPESKQNLAKKNLPVIYCNHLPKEGLL